MRLDFVHCHGSGNDFPLVDARALRLDGAEWATVARALADRAGPVGGDGLLLLTPGDAEHAFGMRMLNSDGSEAETCLNGLRCVARAGLAVAGGSEARVRLATSSATVALDSALGEGVTTVREIAGPAELDVAAFPIIGLSGTLIEQPLAGLPTPRRFTAVAMPNPHLIGFAETIDEAELVRVGAACEAAPDWLPNRANVSFAQVRDAATLFVRTCERGVGLTDSCGSAMAASTYAACVTGRLAFDTVVTVRNRGGMVRARAAADGMVTLSGNATWEWAGTVEVDLATGRAGGLVVERRFDDEVAAWARVVAGLD